MSKARERNSKKYLLNVKKKDKDTVSWEEIFVRRCYFDPNLEDNLKNNNNEEDDDYEEDEEGEKEDSKSI